MKGDVNKVVMAVALVAVMGLVAVGIFVHLDKPSAPRMICGPVTYSHGEVLRSCTPWAPGP
jgi:hypothetical protein